MYLSHKLPAVLESSHHTHRGEGIMRRKLTIPAGSSVPHIFTIMLGDSAKFSKQNNDGTITELCPNSQDKSTHEKAAFHSILSVQLSACVT